MKVATGCQLSIACYVGCWAHTHGFLMTVLPTMKKRHVDMVAHLKGALDHLATALHHDPFPRLFPTGLT
jgi:hypothetical protein